MLEMTIIATAEGDASWQQELRRDPAHARQVRFSRAARRGRTGAGPPTRRPRPGTTPAGPRSWLRNLRHQFS